MSGEDNLRPVRSKDEARERGANGGKKSGEVRRAKKTVRQIAAMLDSLPVTGPNKEVLEKLGVPDDDQTQQTVRLVALHKKAMTGDVSAVRLWLEITGEDRKHETEIKLLKSREKAIKASFGAVGSIGGERESEAVMLREELLSRRIAGVDGDGEI